VPSVATRALLTASGLPAERIGVWGRGVDTDVFSPSRRSALARSHWRAGDHRPVLLYVGRVSKEKRVDLLPGLHEALIRLGIDHRLVVAGEGPWRVELARRCPEAICLGTLGRDRLAEVYASADVFVFPSTTDTAGNVVLEAQASGLPVLVSGTGGPCEQMLPDVSGFVCADAPAAWTVQAGRLLTDAGLRRLMGAAARGYALRRGWQEALAPLYDTYRRVAWMPAEAPRVVPPRARARHVA
jgi:glycosyltransferase involved in cell wall biosynthesis